MTLLEKLGVVVAGILVLIGTWAWMVMIVLLTPHP